MTRSVAVAVAVGGCAAALALASSAGMGSGDSIALLASSGGAAAISAVLGAAVLTRMRRASLGAQAAVVGVTAVVAVAAGAWLAARAMFFSDHDLQALGVVLLAGAGVAAGGAVVLGRRLDRTSRMLIDGARRLGAGDPAVVVGGRGDVGGELARLAEELEAAGQRLARSREREASLEASRRELVAWVSHDLRTPLAGIRALTEALQDGLVDDAETIDRYHATLGREAERLARLVDDLFELSRVQAGVELDLATVHLAEVVGGVLDVARPLAEAKGVSLRAEVDGATDAVTGSAAELSRVVHNLVDNAVRHSDSGEVLVAVRADGGGAPSPTLTLSVSDACGGMPPAVLERAFEPGYRAETSRTVDGASGGLGLAIAKGLVEAHGGTIRAVNRGPGCCFTVTLPAAATTPADQPEPAAPPA